LQSAPAGSLLEYLPQVPDPRGAQGRRHSLQAMLATVVCGILSGARGYRPIAQWIRSQDVSVWHALGFTRKPPGHNAFRDLLMRLSPGHFEAALRQWVTALLGHMPEGELQAIAIDGKTLCGTLQSHQAAIQLLSALDHATGYALSQHAVDPQTNEIKTSLELLKALVLKGRVITGDAMFCQREICEQIVQDGGHYFFVVKDNQPTLKAAIEDEFQAGFSPLHRTTAAGAAL
jgi:DDE_Tnp_1-associated/Transposase DDE domain